MKRLVFLAVVLAASKGFQLQGPEDPTPAQLGGSVLLPCFVEPPLPLEELEVEWRRTDSDVLVHLFQEGEVRPDSQDYAYTGRTHLFMEEVIRGNYSLVLNNVTREDTGVYICKVYNNSASGNITAKVYLEHLLVSGASVVCGYVGEEVVLNCSVDSHIPPDKLEEVTWKRADNEILVLLYQEGEVLPDSSHEQYIGRVEFFTTEIPKGNFSLRLKDVRTEDKGVYICEAYSGDLSANTTVILQELGFSNLHRFILVLCAISLLCNLILTVPAGMCLQRKDTSLRAQAIHFSLIFFPNTLLGLSFILWGIVEGFPGEAAACSTVSVIRFILLIKTAPYLDTLSGRFQGLKTLAVTTEYSIISVVVYSVFFWSQKSIFEGLPTAGKFFWVFFFFIILLCCAFAFHESETSATFLHFSSLCQIIFITLGTTTVNQYTLIGLLVLLLVLYLLELLKRCLPWISFGYALWVITMAISIVLNNILLVIVTGQILERHKERAGLLTVRVLQQSLWSLKFLNHPKKMPEFPHAIVYSLGASGLSLVNSITLMTELILKAETGERNVADLRVIVLTAESVFICCWMLLVLYSAWMRNRHRVTRNPIQGPPALQTSAEESQEMETLSQHPLNGANQ